MNDFPFDAVYDHFARRLVATKLRDEMLEPCLFSVVVTDGEIIVRPYPSIASFFTSASGKAALGEVIREVTMALRDDMCLVMVSEAWAKAVPLSHSDQHDRRHELGSDPDANEVIVIFIYRPDAMRTGYMSIGPKRSVTYQPLNADEQRYGGRMTLAPDVDPVKEVQEAVAKAAEVIKNVVRKN